MISNEIIISMSAKMEKVVKHFCDEIAVLRTGRATISILDNIRVEHYGQVMELSQVASLSITPPNMIIISPWDKSATEPIYKALSQSQIGISPVVDKDIIRLVLPTLSQERRAVLVKVLHQKAEEAKVGIRKEREDVITQIKKLKEDNEIKEDDFFKLKEDIQKVVDTFNNEKIKTIKEKKEKDILS